MSSGSNDGRFANEIETVRDLARKFPKGVEFQHVYAHDDDPGNEQADALARIATADARRARSKKQVAEPQSVEVHEERKCLVQKSRTITEKRPATCAES
ncbi:hypothetical protein Q1695_003319 [Nippostrongylus brasiliensis]|nr:hypothetical protein Q1695_003319 [Nippostrongylus brasiliensis]